MDWYVEHISSYVQGKVKKCVKELARDCEDRVLSQQVVTALLEESDSVTPVVEDCGGYLWWSTCTTTPQTIHHHNPLKDNYHNSNNKT